MITTKVYALYSDSTGLYKIGETSREEVEVRLKEVNRDTGSPGDYEIVHVRDLGKYSKNADKLLHKKYEEWRVFPNKEFFKGLSLNEVKYIVDRASGHHITYPISPFSKRLCKKLNSGEGLRVKRYGHDDVIADNSLGRPMSLDPTNVKALEERVILDGGIIKNPIIVDSRKRIISGHHRHAVAKSLDIDFDVIVISDAHLCEKDFIDISVMLNSGHEVGRGNDNQEIKWVLQEKAKEISTLSGISVKEALEGIRVNSKDYESLFGRSSRSILSNISILLKRLEEKEDEFFISLNEEDKQNEVEALLSELGGDYYVQVSGNYKWQQGLGYCIDKMDSNNKDKAILLLWTDYEHKDFDSSRAQEVINRQGLNIEVRIIEQTKKRGK